MGFEAAQIPCTSPSDGTGKGSHKTKQGCGWLGAAGGEQDMSCLQHSLRVAEMGSSQDLNLPLNSSAAFCPACGKLQEEIKQEGHQGFWATKKMDLKGTLRTHGGHAGMCSSNLHEHSKVWLWVTGVGLGNLSSCKVWCHVVRARKGGGQQRFSVDLMTCKITRD